MTFSIYLSSVSVDILEDKREDYFYAALFHNHAQGMYSRTARQWPVSVSWVRCFVCILLLILCLVVCTSPVDCAMIHRVRH